MPPSAQTNKLTSTLRLLIPRLRLLQKKDTASSVVQRRELAHLLDEGREASARIRVENVIAADIAVEVMEMVELYCELLLARANVLDQVAFGEKGAQARNRAKEAYLASQRQRQPQGSKSGGEAGHTTAATAAVAESKPFLGFSFWGQKKQPTPQQVEPPAASTDATTAPSNRKPEAGGEGSEEIEIDTDLEEKLAYIDPAIDEAAVVIFYAWPRFPHDVRELTMLRGLLTDRYGKEFMTLAQDNKVDDVRVPQRVVKGLRVRPPTHELVESYLREIARAYGSSWGAEHEPEGAELGHPPVLDFVDDHGHDHDHDTGDGDGDNILPSTPSKPTRPSEARRASEELELSKATPPRRLQAGKSPVSVAPPGARTDNPNPRVKIPGAGDTESDQIGEEPPKARKSNGGIPELDELTARFAALRR